MLSYDDMVTLACRTARLASIALEKGDVFNKSTFATYNDRRVLTYEDDAGKTKILVRCYLSGQIEYEATLKSKDYAGKLFEE